MTVGACNHLRGEEGINSENPGITVGKPKFRKHVVQFRHAFKEIYVDPKSFFWKPLHASAKGVFNGKITAMFLGTCSSPGM